MKKKQYEVKPFAPGSDAAMKSGCMCPVEDNNHGRGAYISSEGLIVFWYNKKCPLHGRANDIKNEERLSKIHL